MNEALSVFTESQYRVGEQLTDNLITKAEESLGYRLPAELLSVLRVQNGGTLRRQCLAVDFPNSWASDHVSINLILGLGGEHGMDSEFGSTYMIGEWGYPLVGVVFGETPSGGHDTFMLDYTGEGADGDPSVVYVDEDLVPRRIARSFGEFISELVDCSEFEER